MFDRAGIDIAEIRQTIQPTLAVLDAARRAGIDVVYLNTDPLALLVGMMLDQHMR